MRRTLRLVLIIILSASAASSTPRAQEAASAPNGVRETAPATGSIKGRILDETGQPVSNIVIFLAGRNTARGSAVSDDAGNFSFDGLGPGIYDFSIQSGAYTVAREPGAGRGALTEHRIGDFVTIRLARGGVITGMVTDADGQPLIAAPVRAFFIRNPEGQSPPFTGAREYYTDDRGVYRIYGLPSGTYIVAAGGAPQLRGGGFVSPYETDAPTYYPSTTPDAAAELTVREGQELNGIDIRYRGEQGRIVSGTIEGLPAVETAGQSGANSMLVHTATGMLQGQTFVSGRDGERGFSFEGVPDGEYELSARRYGRIEDEQYASATLRVTVRGADVTGLKLALAPLASINGTLALEPLSKETRATSACTDTRPLLLAETSVWSRRDEADASAKDMRTSNVGPGGNATPDASGEFTLRGLGPGRYRLGARSASDDWYVRSITLSAPPAPRRAAASKTAPAKTPPAPTAAPEFIQLASGQKISAVKLTLAEGAASVRGRVAPAEGEEPAALPPRLRVHLIPTARERVDDPLFFYETALTSDGSFTFTNIAPGRYLLLARPSTQRPEPSFGQPRPAAWDAAARAALRRAAEASNVALDLAPCQRATDYMLRFKF